jgi:hypothetical protein
LVDGIETVLGVTLGDGTKVLDVGKDLVVQGEIVAGDDVDTGILLDLPVGKTKALGLLEELGLRNLAAPVLVCVSLDC